MTKFVNGQSVEMTPEEVEEYRLQCCAERLEPTTEERLAALEAAVLERIMGVAK